MVRQSTRTGLILGDYNAMSGSFKDRFEGLVRRAIAVLFPTEVDKLRATGLKRFRTEFFIVGREVFERVRAAGIIWTFDPTIDLTLGMSRKFADLTLEVVNPQFWDRDDHRNAMGQLNQLTRFVSMLALNRIRLEPRQSDPAEQLASYDALQNCLKESYEVLRLALEGNRPTIQQAEDTSGT